MALCSGMMELMKRKKTRVLGAYSWICLTLLVAWFAPDGIFRSLWPAITAIAGILVTRSALFGLGWGVIAGGLLLTHGNVWAVPRVVLEEHLFVSMQGPWRVGALVFTLILGGYAGLLEHSRGFHLLMKRLLAKGGDQSRRLLTGTYLMGLLCFFDGLASSLVAGRVARPLADDAGVSRERLAWVVDSTGSPVACVAFISTWIASQLSLIEQGMEGAVFQVDPYEMFFRSVPTNAYCLLTLVMVPVAIRVGYQPAAMRKFDVCVPINRGDLKSCGNESTLPVVLIPLLALAFGIFAGFPLLHEGRVNLLSVAGWKDVFGGNGGPFALVFGSIVGLLAAWWVMPRDRKAGAGMAAANGAGALLPAIGVLILAWTLGSEFKALGSAEHLAQLLGTSIAVAWLPLMVFGLGSTMAFCTGSSWGTMGLLMPLAVPAAWMATGSAAWPEEPSIALLAAVIGAVFGGATLGDHVSPFSDTTIVSALASGCDTVDHVVSQLPFAMLAAVAACVAYALMALGISGWIATFAAGCGLIWVLIFLNACRKGKKQVRKHEDPNHRQDSLPKAR